ncbi:MAG: hypothetical protein GXO15_03425 [Crenarchaeota archaeon]|nr:hypothetical protein [Thermoproteota archaeon]
MLLSLQAPGLASPQPPVSARSLPLDAAAARLLCPGGGGVYSRRPLAFVEERLTGSRFTGLVCIEFLNGDSLVLVLVDGVVFGAFFEAELGGLELLGEDALEEAEHLDEPGFVSHTAMRLSRLMLYA